MTREKFSHIAFAEFTDCGLVRPQNEDSFASLPADGCFLVSDGMGGGEAGEVASRIVAERLAAAVSGTAADSPGRRKFAVQQAIHGANREIRDYARAQGYAQMGATLALWLADAWNQRRAWLCHVGDSRIYRLRDGVLEVLTRDHTLGAELAARTANAAFAEHSVSSLSHILTRSIGVAGRVLPEWGTADVRRGDLFMVCSDGVPTMLSDAGIGGILAGAERDLAAAAAQLADRVRLAGARDNYTFILFRIAAEPPEPEVHSEEEQAEDRHFFGIAGEGTGRV